MPQPEIKPETFGALVAELTTTLLTYISKQVVMADISDADMKILLTTIHSINTYLTIFYTFRC